MPSESSVRPLILYANSFYPFLHKLKKKVLDKNVQISKNLKLLSKRKNPIQYNTIYYEIKQK